MHTSKSFRFSISLAAAAVILSAAAEEPNAAPDPNAVPWGVSASGSSFKNYSQWFPNVSAAGVTWVRMFQEWRSIEPAQGTWKWGALDAMLKSAAENKIQINAILMGSAPWTKDKSHAFPMNNLDEWSNAVTTVVDRYKNQVHYWEVWNEGNGSFNDNHHTTTDYANLAAATYTAAKKADPNAQVGLTVASFDAPYLNQTMLALTKAGKSDSFDYLCIHPYEIADGLDDTNGEIPFLWMTRILRDVLKASAPGKANADIWMTEVGRRIEKRNGKVITEENAANALIKIYIMAIAQGITRTQWFEAQDPVGEEDGFGLIKRDGSPRASYRAMRTLTSLLGATPKYQGWLALSGGSGGRMSYGFLFQGAAEPVLVAWATAGETITTVFSDDLKVTDAFSGAISPLKAGQPVTLTETPVILTGIPASLLTAALGNSGKNFPWGGDYSTAAAVSLQLGNSDASKGGGIFQIGSKSNAVLTFPDGSKGVHLYGDQSASFYVHPTYADFQTKEYYVRLTVRRIGPGNAGMNLNYEAADSQGRTPYKNKGEWFSLLKDAGWQTHTWHITDACFSKMWGYDFSFRPENAAPFVIGKVEVSKVPFDK